MRLEKAIEFNKESATSLRQNKFPDHADAVQLGIEALDYVRRERRLKPGVAYTVLVGETPPDTPE